MIAIIDGGGKITVGILRPTVITSQKNRSQNPNRIGIPKEYTKGKILLSLLINFSTANHEWSQAQIDKNQRVCPKSLEISFIIKKAANKLMQRSSLKSFKKLIFW